MGNTNSTRTPPLRTKVNSMKRKKKHKYTKKDFNGLKLKSSSKIKISSTAFYTPNLKKKKNNILLFINFFDNFFKYCPFLHFEKVLKYLYLCPSFYPSDNLCQNTNSVRYIFFLTI